MTNDKAAEAFEYAEREKLGANGGDRIRAVEKYLKTNLTEAKYEAIRRQVTTASGVQILEEYIRERRAAPGAIPGFEFMSFEQRRAAQINRGNGGNRGA